MTVSWQHPSGIEVEHAGASESLLPLSDSLDHSTNSLSGPIVPSIQQASFLRRTQTETIFDIIGCMIHNISRSLLVVLVELKTSMVQLVARK